MSSKNLIISFVTVSIISLAVSAFAILTAARSYSQRFKESPQAAEKVPCESETDTIPVFGTSPESGNRTESADSESDTLPESNTESESTADTVQADVSEEPGSAIEQSFILGIKGGRLTVNNSEGNTVYERIIDLSDIRESDLELLRRGISFSDLDSAIGAIYDLIS